MRLLTTIVETALRGLAAFPVGDLSPAILWRKRRNSAPFAENGRAMPCRLCRPVVVLAALLSLLPVAAAAEDIPRLERRGKATQLLVDGHPFLILGGELGNSEASSREAMRAHWPKLQAMNLNTVLAAGLLGAGRAL